MIKKLLLTAAMIITGIIMVNAQCTNIVYTTSGLHPDSVKHADANVLYRDTLTIIIPADTTISGITIPIDSISFTSITGLPASLTAHADQHHWVGSSWGCIFISGTPTVAEATAQGGVYPLNINLYGYGKYMGLPVSSALPAYTNDTLKVKYTNGIMSLDKSKFTVAQNSPNPFSSNTTIEFSPSNADVYNFTVTNIIGEVVYTQNINAVSGSYKIEFSASNLPNGIYMYKLGNKSEVYTRRMIVSGK